jgi:hypothetical protein
MNQNQRFQNGNCRYGLDVYSGSGAFIGTFCVYNKERKDVKCPRWSRNQALRGVCVRSDEDSRRRLFDEEADRWR